MHRHHKPVRKCGKCPLNMGEQCWRHEYPHDQWRHGDCPGFADKDLHAEFQTWRDTSRVATAKELRRDFFRSRKRTEVHHDSVGHRKSKAE